MTFLLNLPLVASHAHVIGMLLLVLVLKHRLLRVRLTLLIVLHDGAEDDESVQVNKLEGLGKFNLILFSLEDG